MCMECAKLCLTPYKEKQSKVAFSLKEKGVLYGSRDKMMLSTIFVIALSCTMYSSSQTLHMSRESDVETDITLNLRLNSFGTSLKNIENTLQYMHEKSNNWAILKHNIDTWNAQVKDVDHKLTQIRQTQEDQQHKLTSLELTLNHVLSKVIFLSDTNVHTSREHSSQPAGLEEVRGAVPPLERKVLSDLSAQLSNVLYHLTQMVAKHDVTLDTAKKHSQQNDGHQSQTLIRKHAKHLEQMHELLKQIAAQQRSEKKSWQEMTSYYQSVSGELTTFTASLDLLLKRIELVVKYVNSKERGKSQNGIEMNDVIQANGTADNNCIADQNEAEEADEYNEMDEEIEPVVYVQPTMAGCHELDTPRVDGIYKFSEPKLNQVQRDFNERFCAFATDGPAWTVIQKRGPFATQENFNQSWHSYRTGFGSLTKDFWFGNEFIHKIVYQNDHILRIELEDYEDMQVWAEYGLFRLESENFNYQLLIGRYNGSIPDALQYHNKTGFSTYDHPNDQSNSVACALRSGSGWWFNSNMKSNLNGIYHEIPRGHKYNGIIWENWHGDYSMKAVRMLIRPMNFESLVPKEIIEE